MPLKPNFFDSTACKSYPSFIHRTINKKRALWRKHFSLLGKAAYKAQATKCDRLVRKYHAATERRILNSNSSVALFRHVNRKFASCPYILPIKNVAAGVALLTDAEKADAFNNYFASVSSMSITHTPQICQHSLYPYQTILISLSPPFMQHYIKQSIVYVPVLTLSQVYSGQRLLLQLHYQYQFYLNHHILHPRLH